VLSPYRRGLVGQDWRLVGKPGPSAARAAVLALLLLAVAALTLFHCITPTKLGVGRGAVPYCFAVPLAGRYRRIVKIRYMVPALSGLLTLSMMAPGFAHNLDAKSFGQLKNSTKNFAHKQSDNLEKTPSAVRINGVLPQFSIKSVYGKTFTRNSFLGKMTLLVLADTQCPCVQAIEMRIHDLAAKYKDLKPVYVFSQAKEKPIAVARFMQNHKILFPALLDQNQNLLRILNGQCSSEVYLFDKTGHLRYHGRVDDSTFDPKAVKSPDLARAVAAVVANRKVAHPEVPAFGCAIPRI
jgi:hypothetical protein